MSPHAHDVQDHGCDAEPQQRTPGGASHAFVVPKRPPPSFPILSKLLFFLLPLHFIFKMLQFVKFALSSSSSYCYCLLGQVPDPAWTFVARHSRLACFITYLIIASLPFVLFLPEISSASFQILSDNTGQSLWISSGIVLFCQLLAPITSRFMLSHPCDASTKFLRPTPDFSCVQGEPLYLSCIFPSGVPLFLWNLMSFLLPCPLESFCASSHSLSELQM